MRMAPRLLVVGAVLAGVLAGPAGPAFAQDADLDLDLGFDDDPPPEPEVEAPPVRDPKLAKRLADGAAKFVKSAERLERRKKAEEAAAEYERAVAAYLKSFELHPDPRVLVAAAAVLEKLGRWLEAARIYERALAETEVPLDAKGQDRAHTGLDAAMMHFGIVTLVVEPEGAVIELAGEALGEAPLPRPLWLQPGEYALAITRDGYVPLEATLVVDAGSESERRFELEPVPVVVAPPRPPPPPPPPPLPPPPTKTPVWIGAGATIALAGGAVATGILAIGKHGTFTDPQATPDERDAAQSSGRTMALVTDVLTGAAVVAAAGTAYYYLKVYRPRQAEHERLERERGDVFDEYAERPRRRPARAARPKVVVAPVVQGDGAGLVLGGWF